LPVQRHAIVGPPAGEQLIQHHAQGVDVGSCSHRSANQLLWRSVLGGHQGFAGAGQTVLVRRVGQQFGDAEVQQLQLPFGIDEDVAGLEVPVHDQIAVQVAHGLDDHEIQAQDLVHGKVVLPAVLR